MLNWFYLNCIDMKHLVSTLLAVMMVCQVYGQIKLSDFDLVKSFQSNQDKLKPAVISFTIPNKKESSLLINAALGIDVVPLLFDETKELISLFPYIEYNRNTMIDKDQNQLSSGLYFEWILESEKSKFMPVITSTVKYSNDYVSKIESLQGEFFIAPTWTRVGISNNNWYVPGNFVKIDKSGVFGFEYVPYFGIELDQRFRAKADSLKGNITRFVFKIESILHFFPKIDEAGKFLYYYVEMNLGYQYRNVLFHSAEGFVWNSHNFCASLNYIFSKNDKTNESIGIDYVNGPDPTKAFEDQNYFGLSLKVKL